MARVSLLLIWGVLFLSYGSALGIPTWRRGSVVHNSDFLRILDPRTTPNNTRLTEGLSTSPKNSSTSGSRRSSFRNTAKITSQAGDSAVFNLRRTNASRSSSEKFNKQPDEPSVLSQDSRGHRIVTAQPEGSTRNFSQLRTSRVLVQPQGLAVTSRKESEDDYRNYNKRGYTSSSHNSTKSRARGDHRVRIESTLQSRKLRYSRNSTHTNTENDTLRKHVTQSKNNYTDPELLVNPYKARNSTFNYNITLFSSVKHLDRIHEPSRNNVSNTIDYKTQNNLHQLKNKTQHEYLLKEADDEATSTNINKDNASSDINVDKPVVHNVPFALTKSKTQSSFLRYRSHPPMSASHTRQSPPPGLISLDRSESTRIRMEELRRKLFSRTRSPIEANKLKKLRGVTTETQNTMPSSTSTERTIISYTSVNQPKFHTIASTFETSTTTLPTHKSEIVTNINSSNNTVNTFNDNSTIQFVKESQTETTVMASAANNPIDSISSSDSKDNITNLFTSISKSIPLNLDDIVNKTISSDISTSSFTSSTTVHVSFRNAKNTTETSPSSESSHVNKSTKNTLSMSPDEFQANYTMYEESTTAKIATTSMENYFTDRSMHLEISSLERNSTSQDASIMYNISETVLENKSLNTSSRDGTNSPLKNILKNDHISDKPINITKPLHEFGNLHHDVHILTMNSTEGTETITLLDVSDRLSNSSKFPNADEITYFNMTELMVGNLQENNPEYIKNQHNLSLQQNKNGANIYLERNDPQGSDSILIHVKTAGPHQTNIAQSPAPQRLRKDPVKQKTDNLSPSYLYLLSDPLIVDINEKPSTQTHQNAEFVSENKNNKSNDASISDSDIKSLDSVTITSTPEDNKNEFIEGNEDLNLKAINVDNNQTYPLKKNISQNLTKDEISLTQVEKEPSIEVHQSSSHSVSVSAIRIESHSVVSKVSSHRGVKKLAHELPLLDGNHSVTILDTIALKNTEKPSSSHGDNPFGINPFGNSPGGASPFGANPFGQYPIGISQPGTISTNLQNAKSNDSEVFTDILTVKETNQVENSSKLNNVTETISPDKKIDNVVDETNQSLFHYTTKRPDGIIVGEVGLFNHSNHTIFNALRYEADENIDPELIAYGLSLWKNL